MLNGTLMYIIFYLPGVPEPSEAGLPGPEAEEGGVGGRPGGQPVRRRHCYPQISINLHY